MSQVGLKNLYYAKVLTDTTQSTTYETPVRLAGLISVDIAPSANTNTLYADDGPYEAAESLGAVEVTIEVADLPLEAQAALLGHTVTNGVMQYTTNDAAPYVALAFESLKANGKNRFVKLLKGKFSEPETNHQTKGENVEFQTSTITGTFVARVSDGAWKTVADEDATGFEQTTAENWYTAI